MIATAQYCNLEGHPMTSEYLLAISTRCTMQRPNTTLRQPALDSATPISTQHKRLKLILSCAKRLTNYCRRTKCTRIVTMHASLENVQHKPYFGQQTCPIAKETPFSVRIKKHQFCIPLRLYDKR